MDSGLRRNKALSRDASLKPLTGHVAMIGQAYHGNDEQGMTSKDAGKKCFGLFAIEDAGDLINKISQLL
jgi:hypothetical protein